MWRTQFELVDSATCCVVCDAAEPDSGKLLHCLHVVCAPCLQECVSGEGGHVECALCSAKTTAKWRGADLSKQLPDCPSLLYDWPSASRGTRGSASADAAAAASAVAAAAATTTPGGSEPEGIGGRGKVRSCEVCEDDVEDGLQEEARQAISFCETCDGHLLCSRHAERHAKRKRFQDHSVMELSGGHPADGRRWRCPLHPKHDVTQFCDSCEYGLCKRCQADGHSGHAVESIARAAVKYRAMLKECLLKCNVTTSNSSSSSGTRGDAIPADDGKLIALATLQDDITQAKLALEEQAKAASRRITQTFDDAQKLLEKKKELVLRKVDTLLWQSTQPLLEKGQRLSRLEDQYSNAMTLAQRMACSESKEQHVVQIATVVQRNVEKLLTQLEAEKTPVVCAAISSTAQPLSELEVCLECLVSVSDVCIDVEKTNVELADDIVVSMETEATAHLYDSCNRAVAADQPTPNMKAEIVSASGRRQPALVSKKAAVDGGAESHLTLSIGWKVCEVGQHTLELSMAGRMKAVHFDTRPEVLQFDPAKCSSRITLSNNNHTATHIGTSRNEDSSVAAPQGYVTGRHKWSIRVRAGADNTFSIAAGVTVLPRNGDYSGEGWFFDKRRAYFCWCNGTFQSKPIALATDVILGGWQDGDVITFTLDCEGKFLELYLHRTGERRVAKGLRCNEPLHPAVNLYHPDQAVEFCFVPE